MYSAQVCHMCGCGGKRRRRRAGGPLKRAAGVCEDDAMSDREPTIPAEPNASEEPHDVLAAEQFAMPAPEEARREKPVVLPPDPSGIEEPHDILAAEEYAMPAPPRRPKFSPHD